MPPEPLLCAELGVSRTVVREAVKSLVAKGLVTTGPKVGTRLLPSDEWNWFDPDVIRWQSQIGLTREFLRDLQDLRRVLEPAAVLDAVMAHDPKRAEKSILVLIDGAHDDIESVLAGRKRLPRLDLPAAPLRAS